MSLNWFLITDYYHGIFCEKFRFVQSNKPERSAFDNKIRTNESLIEYVIQKGSNKIGSSLIPYLGEGQIVSILTSCDLWTLFIEQPLTRPLIRPIFSQFFLIQKVRMLIETSTRRQVRTHRKVFTSRQNSRHL